MRGSDTCEFVFEDCEVPEENVLGKVGRGVNVLMSGPGLRARRAGGRAARHHAGLPGRGAALCPRAQAVRPAIGEFQLVQGKIADMYVTMNAAQGLCLCRGQGLRPWQRDDAQRTPRARSSSPPRRRPMRARRDPALGGNGYINDYPTGRLLRDAKLYEIGAGTSEIRRMLIGRELFNETA
jgi:isovaleryl-CoA dehydrogenase